MRAHIIVPLVIISAGFTMPAWACSNNKLDLDWCGAAPRDPPPPVNNPIRREEKTWTPPDPHPTVVTPRDSRGNQLYGPGVTKKF